MTTYNGTSITGTSGVSSTTPSGVTQDAAQFTQSGTGNAITATGNATSVYATTSAGTGIGVYGNATAASGVNIGVKGTTGSTGGYGVAGYATATSGACLGGYFTCASTMGYGLYVTATATSGTCYGAWITNSSTGGYGVYAAATATTGTTYGVYAGSSSTSGYGVYATSAAVGVLGHGTANDGVQGSSASSAHSGVWGDNSAGGYGVSGSTSSGTAAGVWGDNTGAGHGVKGTNSASGGIGVYGANSNTGISGTYYGVYGSSASGADSSYGVYGSATTSGATGVYGDGGFGVQGNGRSVGAGVRGQGGAYGVWGQSGSTAGVYGVNNYGNTTGYAIYGKQDDTTQGTSALAGYFQGPVKVQGDVTITGNCSVSGNKPFKIDHPLDPTNKYLLHAVVEAPLPTNVYEGIVTADDRGDAAVTLPSWFHAINTDFRYQLTCIGQPAPNLHVAAEIEDGRFRIGGAPPGARISWHVSATRNDLFNQQNPFKSEEEKPSTRKGFYLRPELYGHDDTYSEDHTVRDLAVQRSRTDSELTAREASNASGPRAC